MASSPSTSTSPAIRAVYDLHCHILPAWDDGPRNIQDSLAMLETARAAGVETIVATPHVGRAFKGVEHAATSIPAGVETLQKEIDARGLGIRLISGAEILLGSVDLLQDGGPLPEWTVGAKNRYSLVESPFRIWPDFGNNLLYELMLRGVRPLIAHPERYVDVQKNIDRMENAVSQGALLQVTAGSLLGRNGKEMQNCAIRLLDRGWAHIIASDAHNDDTPWPSEAIALVEKRVGTERARQIFEDNPHAIIEGESFPTQIEPERPEKGVSFLGRLLGGRK